MDRKELEAKIIELVSTSYNVDIATLTLETTFKEDLKGASILMVGLVSEIENELDATLALQEASACVTIADMVDLVEGEL